MQRKKGPRLWLENRKGRASIWHIRDGEKKRSLGLPEYALEEAEQRLAEYLAEKHCPEPYRAQAGQISIPEVLAYYVKTLHKNASRKDTPAVLRGNATRKIHVANLMTFWADKSVADVRTSICEKYEEHRRAMPPRRGMRKDATSVSHATIRQELKTLRRAISAWHGESPLPAMPIVWTPPAATPKVRCLERHEVARMLRTALRLKFPHLARYILIGVYTGTRDDAIRRLCWSRASHDGWIDTDRGILYRAGFAEAQTCKRRTPMPLPDRLLAHIRRWRRLDSETSISHVITYMRPLPKLRSTIRRAERENTPPRQPQPIGDIHKAWATMVREAGLDRDVTPHTLKHTAISWMLWEGKTIWEVSELTGTSPKTIEEVYGHHRSIESRLARSNKKRAS